MLRHHLADHGTAPDGRLFRGTRGGHLSESVYGRAWHTARHTALGPTLAATPLARRPYDLRHAALTLWLNATSQPAEIAARAGNTPRVLHDTYQHCTHSQHDFVSQQIEDALDTGTTSTPATRHHTAGGHPRRRHQHHPLRRTPTNTTCPDRLITST
jgi:integrase